MSVERTLPLPLSPREEGYLHGLATTEVDDYVMHFDGVDHVAHDIDTEGLHPALVERPDFLEGVTKGITMRRMLNDRGYSVSRHETLDELVAYSHGGSV